MFHLYLLCNIYIKMESLPSKRNAPSTPPKIQGVNTTELLAPPPQKDIYKIAKDEKAMNSCRKLF